MTTLVCCSIMAQKSRYLSLCLNISRASWRRKQRTWTASPKPQKWENMGDTLTVTQAELLWTLVAKMLFVSFRSRTNLKTALAFLNTWVRNPDRGDYKKLFRAIPCIRATQGMEITLEAESVDTIWWWIDAAYSVHRYLKEHPVVMMLLGKGAAAIKSSRRRIKSRSSTESEITGVDDHMTGVLWTLFFLGGQVFKVNNNIVYQDN